MKKSFALLACASLLLVGAAPSDPSFTAFIKQLSDAVNKHDRTAIQSMLAPNIQTGLGAGTGKEEFNKQWANLSQDSPFWQRMARILAHGAEYDKDSGEVHIPNVDIADSDSNCVQGMIWRDNAPLYSVADDKTPPIKMVHKQQVTILEPVEPEPISAKWAKIKLKDGTIGFIKSDDLYSAYDEFATFKKMGGQWKIIWFGFASM